MKIIYGAIIALVFILIFIAGCTETIDTNQIKPIEKTSIPTPVVSEEEVEQNIESEELVNVQPSQTPHTINEDKVNGIDKTKAKIVGPYVIESIEKISPIYSNLRDDFTTKDYDKMATDALILGKYAEDKLDEIAIEEKLPKTELFGKLSSKDLLIYNKFIRYLLDMKEISNMIKLPLSYIKDDPSQITLRDKLDSFSAVMSKSKEATFHFDELMDTCSDFEVDCGQNLPAKKVLEKQIEFL
ncbi:hypothetical protein [Methanospirillum sp.]